MTNTTKTMTEIRDEFITEKYTGKTIGGYEFTERDRLFVSDAFKAGWDARDKLDNEALLKAKNILKTTTNNTNPPHDDDEAW